jgi:soluble lytic murein transglycosylase-like protein
MRRPLVTAALALTLSGCGGDERPAEAPRAAGTPAAEATPTPTPTAAPAPDATLPSTPDAVATTLAEDLAAMRRLAATWDGEGRPPSELTLHVLREQRLEYRLVDRPALRRAVLARLRGDDRRAVRDGLLAEIDLKELSSGWPVKRRLRTQRPAAAADLWRFYRRAQRRFGVSPTLLAAVNLVESAFGRLRNDSVAGAQGPMQFMPATWRAYGLGGNVQDPRDAILGAANYLHANGAAADEAGALYHYNPSRLYVRAVLRYARRMRRDPSAFHALYARQVFVRAAHGRRRITGPAIGRG